MKPYNRLIAASLLLSFFFFSSCKKQIDEPIVKEATLQSSSISSPSCRPATYGVYQNGSGTWITIFQKWYSGGKIQNVKLHFSGRPIGMGINHDEQILNIDWGQVTYEGNQVVLKDVGKNKLVFRVTLDNSGKPVASYLYTVGYLPHETYIDTSYYFYSGDRLNYFIQIFATESGGSFYSQGWEQFTFAYNASGDLASHYARNEEVMTRFLYSSTPTSSSISDYPVTTSFKLLEFLELIKMPMSNAMSSMDMTRLHPGYLPYTFFEKRFFNYMVTDGLVQSYINPLGSGYQTYYIGWDCGGNNAVNRANSQNNRVSNLDQFKELYTPTKK